MRFDARSLSLAVGQALRATPIKDVYSKNEKFFKRLQEVRLSHRIESRALHLVQSYVITRAATFHFVCAGGPPRHSLECVLQRFRQGYRIGLEFRDCTIDNAVPRAAVVAYRAIQRLPLEATRGRIARRGGSGDVLRRAQDSSLRPAVDKHDIRGESAHSVVLRPDYAHAPAPARYRFADGAVLYEIRDL